jgi:uncharacterized membrane protein YphA (DoxX/SURF4 family)
VARILLATALGVAGLSKVGDLAGAGRTVALYQVVPASSAQLVAGALLSVEIALAVLLLAGLATRATAAATAVLMAVYVAAIVSVWARGLSIDCGCFGGGGAVTAGAVRGYVVDILRDVVLAGAAAFLVRRPVTECSLDRWVMDTKGR